MSRIDIARIRKKYGMSQSELAHRLQINQSFLSAIENGKSALPPDKAQRLQEIFGISDMSGYLLDGEETARDKESVGKADVDLIGEFLTRFHSQAHSNEEMHHHHDHHERIHFLEQQNAQLLLNIGELLARVDRLMTESDALRHELDRLRSMIFRYKTEGRDVVDKSEEDPLVDLF